MNPDPAVPAPAGGEASGASPAAATAERPLRALHGELLSVRGELRAALYLAVLLITSGVGLLVAEQISHLGPLTIAIALGLAAAACFAWVARTAPPFAWSETASPNLAFDYLLLLGVLLVGSDLAWIEASFTPLGRDWPWHLLIVAGVAGAAAVRFDSRVVFSLALASFAAWRGISVGLAAAARAAAAPETWTYPVRANAAFCGALFVFLGIGLQRTRRKAHFEPVATHLGCLLVLGSLAAGMIGPNDPGDAWATALLVGGVLLAAGAWRMRRFSLFAFGVVGAFLALCRVMVPMIGEPVGGCMGICVLSTAMIAGLLAAHRSLARRAPPP